MQLCGAVALYVWFSTSIVVVYGAFGSNFICRGNLLTPGVKVITDIDDTVVSSGGHRVFGVNIGGVDNQYQHGDFYPGVTQFCFELANAGRSLPRVVSKLQAMVQPKSTSTPNNHISVSILTARAKELKFAMALKPSSKIFKAFHSHGFHRKDWQGIGNVHYGSIAEWIVSSRRGWRKFKNFERMIALDDMNGDHRPYVFIGDTGDRDEDAAERMAAAYPQRLKAVFLHAVHRTPAVPATASTSSPAPAVAKQPDKGAKIAKLLNVPEDRHVNGVPVYYFRTYIGAAVKAYTAHLIDRAALKRIAVRAIQDMRAHDGHLRATVLQGSELRRETSPSRVVSLALPQSVPVAAAASVRENRQAKPGRHVQRWRALQENLQSKWEDLRRDARSSNDYDLTCYVK